MEIFDPVQGIIHEPVAHVRDVSEDLSRAEQIIQKVTEPVLIEELIKTVQQTCALTNSEIYGLLEQRNTELKSTPVSPEDEPIIK
jgi:hypothetical protein